MTALIAMLMALLTHQFLSDLSVNWIHCQLRVTLSPQEWRLFLVQIACCSIRAGHDNHLLLPIFTGIKSAPGATRGVAWADYFCDILLTSAYSSEVM